ncbi:unnamed protein product [Ascophyllum nodosum]
MTAREGRAAARLAGMRAGDWQAERQLQEALRESRRVRPEGRGIEEGAEESVLEAGFRTPRSRSAVSEEDGEEEDDAPDQARPSSTPDAEAGYGSDPTTPPRGHGDYGDHEVVITRDGGVNPVTLEIERAGTSAAGAGTALGSAAAMSAAGRRRADESTTLEAAWRGRSKESVADEGQGGKGDNEGEGREGLEGQEKVASPRRRKDAVLTLFDDALHRIMLFLHPEDISECRAVSSQWTFPQHEAVFEGLCRRTYPGQSVKKSLNVKRWRSWQRMFKLRPRLRTSGLYSLKTTYFKSPVRDMCTSWVPGVVLEVTYYRYFRFYGDGRVAYGLTHENPKEFVRLIKEGSPKIFFGTYTISKWEVNVEVPNPWSRVSFSLQLANGERGRFTHLVLVSHTSVARNEPRANRCHHRVKSSDHFTFERMLQF